MERNKETVKSPLFGLFLKDICTFTYYVCECESQICLKFRKNYLSRFYYFYLKIWCYVMSFFPAAKLFNYIHAFNILF
jgi:hypothetical protein